MEACNIIDVPLIVSEHDPSRLGPTTKKIDIGHAFGVYAKTRYSMMIPEVEEAMSRVCNGNLQCAVLFGTEVRPLRSGIVLFVCFGAKKNLFGRFIHVSDVLVISGGVS